MNRMLKGWRQTRRGAPFQAYIANDADDFAIVSRHWAEEALEWTRAVPERTLNEIYIRTAR
jgi:RNA-directed DNA polymerase